ncbi:amino acid ABC transporter substrate-binding protein [Mesobacillus zeae]|uniref:Amino acid ABC transporter substrate-binding protein n=1 Tax=Mesobacillus zeae TaxID=1917180 RepID=A0A398AWW2_9BACI|nr:amino acid ABC transporter substrate-binding protein [Mesobacillus zeae]RID81534.1 amino acid ABC transporter substrate-binding protein [Mesobacillus zeae]
MKKFLCLISLLLAFTLAAAGCGSNDSKNQKHENSKNGSKDLLAEVEKEGKLVIGTEGTYPPFSFHDQSGKLTGFDVEIASEIAKRIGVKPEFVETQWDAMFAGLDSKRFDMVANQVGIRPDREEKYSFSKSYTTSTAVLITRTDNQKIKSFDDIKGLKSAQSMTSNYAEMAKKNGANLVGVEGFNQAIELLQSKRADITINDNLSFLDYKMKKPDANVKIVAESKDASKSGLMFRKNTDPLVDKVNGALNDMVKDGTYEKISQKWFGENVLK